MTRVEDLVAPYRRGSDRGRRDGRRSLYYRSARANPDKFYIGIDVQAKALEKISEKIHRKPEKGGLRNVLFVQAAAEELPPELNRVADEIHIHFPWGSLLRSVAMGDEKVLAGLRRISASGAWLEVVIGIDEHRDVAEVARLGLPPLTEEYVRSTLIPRYEMAKFKVEESGISSHADSPHIETTWAKRLRNNSLRQLLSIIGKVTS